MRLTGWRLLAVISAAVVPLAVAATRPRYGGTLRLQMRERVQSLDPAEKAADAAAKLQMVIFDRLVRFDDNGRLQPSLALSWQVDGEQKRWEFRLRPGVKFHDGYPLTAAAVAGTVQRLLGDRASVAASGDGIVIQSGGAIPGLLAELATAASSMAGRGPDGALVGTGPFRVARFDAGRHATLAAFDEHWGGRPFTDAIEVEMGRATRDQLVDLQVGKADLVELAPDEIRLASERGTRIWTSAPIALLALVFGQPAAADEQNEVRLREALALSIDRGAIYNVLLQRQGSITGALVPQWLSGYAFLFPAAMDLQRARQLVGEVPPGKRALAISDPGDSLGRIIAERIALNARDAGILLQVTNQPKSGLRLARVHFSAPDAARALAELASGLGLAAPRFTSDWPASPESLYAAERSLLEGFHVVPLFHLPDAYGAGQRVRLWLGGGLSRVGELRLADIWLEGNRP